MHWPGPNKSRASKASKQGGISVRLQHPRESNQVENVGAARPVPKLKPSDRPAFLARHAGSRCYVPGVDVEGQTGEAESSRDGGVPTRQVKRAPPSVPPTALSSVPPSVSTSSSGDLNLSREALRD